MKFAQSWIAEYVDLPEDAEELATRLTGAGLAVEGIERHGGDTILEIDVTANRTDAMNHYGLARELAALYDRPLRTAARRAQREPARPPAEGASGSRSTISRTARATAPS